ncbi:MAG TPA: type II toxin-antitoxin system HipA family toxin [Conexibacter sp.]|nr:type II toxin-antitoxin system HipA family toxin [Conexibacter sp.]
MADTAIDVIVQIAGEDVVAGRLWSHRRRGGESATFAYATDYLARADAYALDPALPLATGQQQTPVGRGTFGAFSDCAPDRWGRRLLQRAERVRVRGDDATERSLGEIDYLLGVRDDLRQGALRFRELTTGTYVADEHSGVPNLVELPRLLAAAERLEHAEATEADLVTLERGGSSLGGARPKAHVLDGDGRLAIAKLPSPTTDGWDVIRWEGVALALARRAGMRVPDAVTHVFDGKAILVVDRFDRESTRRIGYVSAMTMLEATDGDSGSYLDIADAIERHAPNAGADLRELWRRIAFTVLISNTDDHLRNHGFLRTSSAGWSLSPAFDLNPDPAPGSKRLSTAIGYDDNAARVDVLMDVAEHFRLTAGEAAATLHDVVEATSGWRREARTHGLSSAAVEQMEPAFEHAQADTARALVGALA